MNARLYFFFFFLIILIWQLHSRSFWLVFYFSYFHFTLWNFISYLSIFQHVARDLIAYVLPPYFFIRFWRFVQSFALLLLVIGPIYTVFISFSLPLLVMKTLLENCFFFFFLSEISLRANKISSDFKVGCYRRSSNRVLHATRVLFQVYSAANFVVTWFLCIDFSPVENLALERIWSGKFFEVEWLTFEWIVFLSINLFLLL